MANLFTGVFAGKIALCSTQPGGPNYYLTTFRQSDGHHGWIYTPGMNASALTDAEKFILYRFPDGFYRIRAGYIAGMKPNGLPWLTLNVAGGFVEYGNDPDQAAAFVVGGSPFGSSLQINTSANGNQTLYYQLTPNPVSPNLLTLNNVEGDLSTFAPTRITPSLDDIRQQKQARNGDFVNAILLGQDLSQGIDFTGASFVNAQLAGVNFTGATLDQVNMSQTDLRGLNWGQPASAAGIDLTGSNASGCQLGDRAWTKQLNCQNANLSTAILAQTMLANLNLQSAQLGSANLNGAVLDSSNLTSANLNGAAAVRASFQNATLTDATAQMGVFIQAVFDHATMTRIRMGASSYLFAINSTFKTELDTSKFPQSDLIAAFKQNGITLNPSAAIEVQMAGERWQIDDPLGPYKLLLVDTGIQVYNVNPNLVPAVLQGASLVGAQASTASLSGADLRGVQWSTAPATLDHADLEDAAFSGAVLVSTDFTQANLSGADFSNCVLIMANFTGCVAGPGGNRRAISFEGAQLEGANFSKATFNGALLTNAAVALANGAPLLFLPTSDQQYLTAGGVNNLKPAFTQAGFDLGSSPVLTDNSTWVIDNSQSTDPRSPKTYNVSAGRSGFQVFGNGQFLFSLPATAAALLNQPAATPPLVSMFTTSSQHQYVLAPAAPIAKQGSWTIAPGSDAVFLKSYRFQTISVVPETNRLVAYGVATVLIRGLSGDVAFNSTQNLSGALSANAIGPSGTPYAWLTQGLVDNETFYLPLG